MRTEKEIVKLIDDFFHNRIPAGYIEEAIKILAEKPGNVDIDQLMRKHWREKSTRQMPNEKEFNVLLDNIHHRINLIEESKIRTLPGKGQMKGKYRKCVTYIVESCRCFVYPVIGLVSILFL